MSDIVEVMARAIAFSDGTDPDNEHFPFHADPALNEAHPAWHDYKNHADSAIAALAAAGFALVPRDPTGEMFSAALDATGDRVEPYTAPRECGVPMDSDITADEAAQFNEEIMQGYGKIYRAMLAASQLKGEGA